MFVKKVKSPHIPNRYAVVLVESVRDGAKVRHKKVKHMGMATGEKAVQHLVDLAEHTKAELLAERQPPYLPLFNPEEVMPSATPKDADKPYMVDIKKLREDARVNKGIPDVFGKVYDRLALASLFKEPLAKKHNEILKSCVLARLANPCSKSSTAEYLEQDFGIMLHQDKIYRMMDHLDSERVKALVCKATMGLLREKVRVMFYDTTTLYFESFADDNFIHPGWSKDGKFKENQVVLALITTTDGLPVSYEVFPGNTSEVQTLIPSIEKLRERFDVEEVEFVADRGLSSQKNMAALEKHGLKYVMAAKLRVMDEETQESVLAIRLRGSRNKYLNKEITYKGRRLVISYCPKLARKHRKQREAIVKKLREEVDAEGKITAKKILKNAGKKRYLSFDEDKQVAEISLARVRADKKWDGIRGYITNSSAPMRDVAASYKRLWVIEEAFRINKHDLKVRPIFHRKEDRIRAHLDICFIAYALARQLMYRYKHRHNRSVSFDVMRKSLLKTCVTVLTHTASKERFLVPSNISPLSEELYQLVDLNYSPVPSKI